MKHEINPVQIDLLKNELKMNGINLDVLFERYAGFIESLAYGLFTPPHESRMPEWGMFFLSGELPSEGEIIDSYKPSFCDGHTTFGIQSDQPGEIRTMIFDHNLMNDEILDMCSDESSCAVIHTYNMLKIYYDSKIFVCENRNWRILGSAGEAFKKIRRIKDDVNETVYTQIIRFAYYELSLNRIGGIIVYWMNDEYEESDSPISDSYLLDFQIQSHKKMLKHYMSQNDGAVIINESGKVLGGNVHLAYSHESAKAVKASRGTRHTSSHRFSFDNPRSIVVTISQDGPVSVYYSGRNLITIED